MARRRGRRRHALQSARKLPLAKRMGFSALVLVTALALMEAGVRIGMEEPVIPSLSSMHRGTAMEPHPTRMWTLRRDMTEQFGAPTRVKEQGLRAVQTTGAPLKILTLGDSSIFGHALAEQDTLHAHLKAALGERGVEVDVLCGAIPGYSTEQTLRLLDEVGWDLKPDLIVIGTLWSDNNLDHFVDAEWMALLNSPVSRFDGWMRSWSRAWRTARSKTSPQVSATHGADFSPVGWIRDPEPEGRRRVPPTDYANNLDRILLEAQRRGVGALMFQPVNPERLTGEVDRSAWGAYFEIQRGIATRRGVPIVDGVESLRASGLGVGRAFLDDLHPTGAANRVYAEAVAERLVERGWPGTGLSPDSTPPLYDSALSDPWMEGTGGPAWRTPGKEETVDEEETPSKPLVTPGPVRIEAVVPEQAFEGDGEAVCPGCDVVLITVCSLRRDHVGAYGSSPARTPALDSFAQGAWRFDTAYSASAFTLSSLAAILTGRFGSSTGVLGWDKGLVRDLPTLPEVLGLYGYSTAGFTTDAPSGFRPDYGLDRGFQHMRITPPPADSPDGGGVGRPQGPGAAAGPTAQWIRDQPSDKPIFAMFHSRTAHYPFVWTDEGVDSDSTGVTRALWLGERETNGGPMPGMDGGTAVRGVVERKRDLVMETMNRAGAAGQKVWNAHYADAVSWMDHDIALVLDALKETNRMENTVVIVVADHGESLGQHREMLHGDAFYDEVVRIPWLMKVPGWVPTAPVQGLVSHVDLMPTVLELVGATAPAGMDGVSVLPLLQGRTDSIRSTALVEGSAVWPMDGLVRGAVISPPWALLRQDLGCGDGPGLRAGRRGPIPCLYNLDSDPGQDRNVARNHPQSVESLVGLWDGFARARAGEVVPESLRLDPRFVNMLQASGYDFRPSEPQ
ncbi:MAG: sulfatase-like hydrolase/transferase [Myxococcota bacterium]|nr:sulfatase-like hydrolase/transferase [Myxococcota bacterium]